jgi:hypothetical protein
MGGGSAASVTLDGVLGTAFTAGLVLCLDEDAVAKGVAVCAHTGGNMWVSRQLSKPVGSIVRKRIV